MKSLNNLIAVARITKTRGLKGELQFYSLFNAPERFERCRHFLIGEQSYRVKKCRVHDMDRLRVTLAGVDTIEAAQALVGQDAFLTEEEIPRFDDEFFDFELRRMRVEDEAGEDQGRIVNVLTPGAHDVYEIESPDGKRWMIPVNHQFVPVIDRERQLVVIRPIPGMRDDDAL